MSRSSRRTDPEHSTKEAAPDRAGPAVADRAAEKTVGAERDRAADGGEGHVDPRRCRVSRRSLVVGGGVAIAVVIVAALLLLPGEGRLSARVGIGREAPTFNAPTLDDGRLDLRALRGEPVLLNFWGSWCVPCRTEFPRLAALHASGVAVVGVLFKDQATPASAFVRDQRAAWPSVLDPNGELAAAYAVTVAPVTFALDRNGVVRARHLGEVSEADLAALLSSAQERGEG